MRSHKLLFAISTLIAFSYIQSADAKPFVNASEDDVLSIKERMAQETKPMGMRVPAQMLLHPYAEIEGKYDDNIYRTTTGEKSDFITSIRPGVAVVSDWKRHQLNAGVSGDFGMYKRNDDEDYEDYTIQADGRLDVMYDTYFHGGVKRDHKHEDRSSPDDISGDEPTTYDVTTANVGFAREAGRLKFHTSAKLQDFSFDSTPVSGVPVSNSSRDREMQAYQAKIAYEYIPNYEIFGRISYNERSYDSTALINRDSDGIKYEGGAALNLTGKAKGEVFVGYMDQDYDAGFNSISETNYGGSLLWNISQITSLRGEVSRDVRETTVGGASAYLRTAYNVEIEHEIYRDTLLTSQLGFIQDDFSGLTGGKVRDDEMMFAGVGLEYRLVNGVALRAGYDYFERDSTVASQNYDNNVFLLSASYTY